MTDTPTQCRTMLETLLEMGTPEEVCVLHGMIDVLLRKAMFSRRIHLISTTGFLDLRRQFVGEREAQVATMMEALDRLYLADFHASRSSH